MEKKIELENVEISVVGGHASNADGVVSVGQSGTSDELMDRFVVIKFGDKECSNFGSDEPIKIEMDSFAMDETERKFIIMSRIAVALRRKGLHCSVDIHDSDFCCLTVFLHAQGKCVIVEKTEFNNKPTESELLDWWSAIENGVE